jgi:hypothetical protein
MTACSADEAGGTLLMDTKEAKNTKIFRSHYERKKLKNNYQSDIMAHLATNRANI